MLKLLLTRPDEFRTLLQFKLFHEQKRDLTAIHEHPTSGWDRQSMRRCWEFLDMTSRSFSAVIKELDGELARVVSLFLSIAGFRLGLGRPRAAPAHYRPLVPSHTKRSKHPNIDCDPCLKLARSAYSTSCSEVWTPSKMTCPSQTTSNNQSSVTSTNTP